MKPPIVRTRRRVDGWTPERQRAFLKTLAETGSISRAVAAIGLSRASLYALRRRPGAKRFDAACDAAYAAGHTAMLPTRFAHANTAGSAPRDWLAEGERLLHLVNFRPSGGASAEPPRPCTLSTSSAKPLAPTRAVP